MDIKVEGHPDLVRRGAAVVSVDKSAFRSYVKRREEILAEKRRVEDLEGRVERMENSLLEILQILRGVKQ